MSTGMPKTKPALGYHWQVWNNNAIRSCQKLLLSVTSTHVKCVNRHGDGACRGRHPCDRDCFAVAAFGALRLSCACCFSCRVLVTYHTFVWYPSLVLVSCFRVVSSCRSSVFMSSCRILLSCRITVSNPRVFMSCFVLCESCSRVLSSCRLPCHVVSIVFVSRVVALFVSYLWYPRV